MVNNLSSAFWFLLLMTGPTFAQDASKSDRTAEEPKTYEEARALAAKTPGFKNLQRIGLAFHGYHDIFGKFPPATLLGPDGKTPYSWRVELLPILKHYVEEIEPEKLREKPTREQYNKLIADCGYDLRAPWDSPKNRKLLETMPQPYRHPTDKEDSVAAAFYAVVGTGTVFDPHKEARYNTAYDVKNDAVTSDSKGWPATTLMVVESRSNEPWTKPIDIAYSESSTVPRFGGFTKNGFLALTCDGAVHFVSETVSPENLRAFIKRDNKGKFTIMGIPNR